MWYLLKKKILDLHVEYLIFSYQYMIFFFLNRFYVQYFEKKSSFICVDKSLNNMLLNGT